MPGLAIAAPPLSVAEPVTEALHGVTISDPYRWLEEQDSPRTREWIEEQTLYARNYLDHIPGREKIRKRVREFLEVETYDSLQRNGTRYFFRKRLANQQQPCLCMREGADGQDQILVDPAESGAGAHMAVKLLRVSADGRLLLYEVKDGGERTGTFALLDIEKRTTLPDVLSRGYLRGFAFAADGRSFYYSHEAVNAKRPSYRAILRHVLGTPFERDEEIFSAGEDEQTRLGLLSEKNVLGILVYRFGKKRLTSLFLRMLHPNHSTQAFVAALTGVFSPRLIAGRILALTDRDAPNFRIVELRLRGKDEPEWINVIPESDARIHQWQIVGEHLFVSYIRNCRTQVSIFDLSGKEVGTLPVAEDETVRLLGGSPAEDELLFETESFSEPSALWRYSISSGTPTLWSRRNTPFDPAGYAYARLSYASKDGSRIPMFLVGRRDALESGSHPVIMTAYGGYGVSMTPQFSVFVAFLLERGCLFALPNIRGGSEFGSAWHKAAMRRNRQTAYDDFLRAAEWLIQTGRTSSGRLAIFGGSNSGLLVGAAMTQRPELFRAVVCMVPMLDMLRYHLFDGALIWKEEFGTAEDAKDFTALLKYSPYHQIREGAAYPATLLVSGDADRNCNPLHARKMTARLQAANRCDHPIVLDYSRFRGHSPVLPLSERLEALTDRMAFLCDQLELPV